MQNFYAFNAVKRNYKRFVFLSFYAFYKKKLSLVCKITFFYLWFSFQGRLFIFSGTVLFYEKRNQNINLEVSKSN